MANIRSAQTHELDETELGAIRALLDEAFDGEFSDDDWEHTIGGIHVLLFEERLVAHASVVERRLVAGEQALRAGYVEGVATAIEHRRRGQGSAVMQVIDEIIRGNYELGALSTSSTDFYARLGWESWKGPTYVQAPDGNRRPAEEDDGVMILRTAVTQELDTTTSLTCDWRSGDVW